MKKMSEIFILPIDVSGAYCNGFPFIGSEAIISYGPAAESVAHAINHVDALADALENLVSDYERHVELYGTDLTDDDCARIDKKMKDGRIVLNTYRGGQ